MGRSQNAYTIENKFLEGPRGFDSSFFWNIASLKNIVPHVNSHLPSYMGMN